MAEAGADVPSPLDAALQGIADGATVDWLALGAGATDSETRSTIEALRQIELIACAHRSISSSPLREPPFSWGPLEVRQHLARGAHGDVYRAWDPRLEREVALKLLRSDLHDVSAPVAVHEGRLLARIRHANVITVYGADRIDGEAGVWMELVDGRTLQQRVQDEGPLPVAEVTAIGIAVCAGLAAVHAAHLVHRDVKAQNVMQDVAGRTILMDLSAGHEHHDWPAVVAGTPLYLAPELLEGEGKATCASDLYSVGVLLFFLLTGEYPFNGDTFADLRATHRRQSRTRLARRDVPRALSDAIARALERTPSRRFESALAMQQAIATAAEARRGASVIRFGWAAVLTLCVAFGVVSVIGPPTLPADTADANPVPSVALPSHAFGAPTIDGRFIPFIDSEGSVFRWDVRARTSMPLARADPADGRASHVVLAHDGRAAVYAWDRSDGMQELRAVEADGRWPRVLLPPQRGYRAVPLDWSRDTTTILTWLQHSDGTSNLVLVPARRGPPRVLLSTTSGTFVSGGLAPDGSFAVVSLTGTPADGLTVLAPSGQPPRRVVAGYTRFAQVLTDGRVFFLREDKGQEAGWVLALDGQLRAVREPQRVAGALGGVWQARLTDDDRLVLLRSFVSAEVYTVPVDASGTTPTGPPARIDPSEPGNHVSPAWSPDGRFLAYFTIRQTTPGLTPRRTLVVRDMLHGVSRPIPVPLVFLGGYMPRWSPDGRSVAVWGRDTERDEGWGYFRVDVSSGTTSSLVRLGRNDPARAQYAPDGRAFLYVHPTRGIVSRDLHTGDERVRVAVRPDCRPGGFVVDPSGAQLAFTCVSGPSHAAVTSLLVQQGQRRPVIREKVVGPAWIDVQAWTPDGAALIVMRGSGSQQPGTLWRVSPSTAHASSRRIHLPEGPTAVALSPDGRRLAYVERMVFPELSIFPVRIP